jgi:CRISPR-associated endoribonuclease Cas6
VIEADNLRKEEMITMLTLHCLRMVAEAATPLSFDEYTGSAFRGALFRALMGRFCTNREAPACQVCLLVSGCPVASLVTPLREEGMELQGFGDDLPRPFVVWAPCRQEGKVYHRYEPGEPFTFGLTLIGTSAKLFPFVLRALQVMEQDGIGRPVRELHGQRGRLLLREVHAYHPWTSQKQVLWRQGEAHAQRLTLSITGDDIAARAQLLSSEQVTLHFLSPTRLIAGKQALQKPSFYTLMLRLAERLERLHQLYTPLPPQQQFGREWYLQVAAAAGAVQLVRDETHWVRVTSHSARQQQNMPLDGFVGHAQFQGDLTTLRELLAWGEVVCVGKNVTKSGGHYSIVEEMIA